MKISVDDQELFRLSETQKKVIKNDIHEDIFDSDMKRRLNWVLMHKYERCMERLKSEWMPKIKSKHAMIPSDDDALAELIFSDPEYKSRKARDLESVK
jgi:hypothetical protein